AIPGIESPEVRVFTNEWRKRLPTKTEADGEPLVDAPFILGVNAGVISVKADIGAGLSDIAGGRQSQKQIRKRIAAEGIGIKGKGTETVGSAEAFEILVSDPPEIDAEPHGMLPLDPGQVVRHLDGLRAQGSRLIPPDRRKSRAVSKVECGEG